MSARKTVLGRDLRVGNVIIGWWGETPITRLERYLVPAKVLHESVAAANPKGKPAVIVYWHAQHFGHESGCTVFLDEECKVLA